MIFDFISFQKLETFTRLYWRFYCNLVAAWSGGYKVAIEPPIQSAVVPVCGWTSTEWPWRLRINQHNTMATISTLSYVTNAISNTISSGKFKIQSCIVISNRIWYLQFVVKSIIFYLFQGLYERLLCRGNRLPTLAINEDQWDLHAVYEIVTYRMVKI
jgi:hypothetical protein